MRKVAQLWQKGANCRQGLFRLCLPQETMELIMISESKLKIMLTSEDMRAYSIDCSMLDYENTETRRAFWSILDEAKHRTGFDAASEKVFVQVYPSKEGGCEMYITKLGSASGKKAGPFGKSATEKMEQKKGNEKVADRRECLEAKSAVLQSRGVKDGLGIERISAFKFSSMELLLKVCRQLHLQGCQGESSAYSTDTGEYFLVIKENTVDFYSPYLQFSFVGEYGQCVEYDFVRMSLGEHCRTICEKNALQVLSAL